MENPAGESRWCSQARFLAPIDAPVSRLRRHLRCGLAGLSRTRRRLRSQREGGGRHTLRRPYRQERSPCGNFPRIAWRRPSIAKLAQDGHSLLYCDSLGGQFATESGNAIAVFHGFAYVTGTINGRFFPVVNAFQDSPPGGRDVFVSKISQDGNSFSYSTYLGGNQNDEGNAIAVGPGGDAHVTGRTGRTDIDAEHDRKLPGPIEQALRQQSP